MLLVFVGRIPGAVRLTPDWLTLAQRPGYHQSVAADKPGITASGFSDFWRNRKTGRGELVPADLAKSTERSSLQSVQQCTDCSSQGAEQACACSLQQSRPIPWAAPVPFPVAGKWHLWATLYTVPPAVQGYMQSRVPIPAPQDPHNCGSWQSPGEHGRWPCYPLAPGRARPPGRNRRPSRPPPVRVATAWHPPGLRSFVLWPSGPKHHRRPVTRSPHGRYLARMAK